MEKYRVAITPTTINVVRALKKQEGIKGIFQLFSTENLRDPLSEQVFESFNDAIQFFENQQIIHEVPKNEVRSILGETFALQQIATEYEFAENQAQFLINLSKQRSKFFNNIVSMSKLGMDSSIDNFLVAASKLKEPNANIEFYANWPDLSTNGVYLAFTHIDGVGEKLVIIDKYNKGILEKLAEARIKPVVWSPKHSSGIYYLDSQERKFKASQLAAAFGIDSCPMHKNYPKHQVVADLEHAYSEKAASNFREVMTESRVLGINYFGQTVFEYNGVRHVKFENGYITESTNKNSAVFLSALDDSGTLNRRHLQNCLLPIAKEIFSGQPTSIKQLEQAGKIYLRKVNLSQAEVFELQEALETTMYEMYGLMYATANTSNERFELAKTAYFSQPRRKLRLADTIDLGQYSTPIPMAFIAQQFVLSAIPQNTKCHVLEPTVGNGGLISILSRLDGFSIKGVELDSARVNKSINVELTINDTTIIDYIELNAGQKFNAVIANPPFGQLPSKIHYNGKIAIQRLDYFIALKALDAREDQGCAVFILGADGHVSNGAIRGSSKYFYNFIHNNYHVHGLVELGSQLYERSGANTNVRMLIVGDKLAQPFNEANASVNLAPETIPLLKNYDELYAWSLAAISKMNTRVFDFTDIEPDLSLMKLEDKPFILVPSEPDATQESEAAEAVTPIINMTLDLFDMDEPEKIDTQNFSGDEGIGSIHVTQLNQSAFNSKACGQQYVKEIRTRKENEFQVPYQSGSKIAESTAMIPINMAASTYLALERITNNYPDIDQFVCNRLGYESKEKLGTLFSAEQIDALALAIYSHEETGRAIINADQTGIGKGRFMAAMMRYSRLQGMTPIFLTYKDSLMSDIFRDIAQIESQHLFQNLLSINNGVINNYFDPTKPLSKGFKPSEFRKIIASRQLPEETDLVLGTYSQFSKNIANSVKAQYMEAIIQSNKGFLLLDESHIAAGESNTNTNIASFLAVSAGAVFSSATALKNTNSFKLYQSIFPPSINIQSLPDTLRLGGEGLQEALSNCLAADGVLVCRQHDLSNLEIKTVEAGELEKVNQETSDKVANVLTMMSALSGDISEHVQSINLEFEELYEQIPDQIKKAGTGRMHANSMNFGSRLYNITRQFLLGIQVEQAAQLAISNLDNNIKPVIGVENTGESFLHTLVNMKIFSREQALRFEDLSGRPKNHLTEEEKSNLSELIQLRTEQLGALVFDEIPQFKDYLHIMLDRIRHIYVKDSYGVGHYETVSNPEYIRLEDAIRQAIDDLPNTIPIVPLDAIRQRLADKGYKMGEVSGRSIFLHQISRPEEGGGKSHVWIIKAMGTDKNASQTINAFQNGEYDALTITRAGSTGFSMHADPLFKDTRQRNFIALQKAANIADFLQWIGRVNRKNQVIPPIISNLSSGLPAELRLTMMHNAKLRKLSANITSNRENKNIEHEEVDFLNKTGDEIALNYLLEKPYLAHQLEIKLPTDIEDTKQQTENYYINRMMSRLVLLPVVEQENIICDLSALFAERLEELEAMGINPFKVVVHEWQARRVNTCKIKSYTGLDTNSHFDAPLHVSVLEFDIKRTPYSAKDVSRMVEDYLDKHSSGQEFNDFLSLIDSSATDDRKTKLDNLGKHIQKQLCMRSWGQLPQSVRNELGTTRNLENAIDRWRKEGKHERAVEIYEQSMVGHLLSICDVGAYINVTNSLGEVKPARVVDFILPNHAIDISHLARTGLKIVVAGDDKVTKLNLAKLYRQRLDLAKQQHPQYLSPLSGSQLFEAEINASMGSTITKKVQILENNLFKATEMATENKMGHPILYTDSDGIRHRAILLRPEFSFEDMINLPVKFSSQTMMDYITEYFHQSHGENGESLASGYPIFNSRMTKESKIGLNLSIITKKENDFKLIINDPKTAASKLLLRDGKIFANRRSDSTEGLQLEMVGSGTYLQCDVKGHQLKALAAGLEHHGVIGLYLLNPDESVLSALRQKMDAEKNSTINDNVI